jgi:hypothetical protein
MVKLFGLKESQLKGEGCNSWLGEGCDSWLGEGNRALTATIQRAFQDRTRQVAADIVLHLPGGNVTVKR